MIAKPGDVVTVLHLPGSDGVTGESSAVLAVAVAGPFVVLPLLFALFVRRRVTIRSAGR